MTGASTARRFLLLAACAAGAFIVFYLVFEHTVPGQAWSDQAYLGHVLQPHHAQVLEDNFLHRITIGSSAATCAIFVLIGFLRRIPLAGLFAAIGLGVAAFTAEALARTLPHPDLATGYESLMAGKMFQTSPSGHSTIATGITLGFVLLATRRWLVPVAVVGAFFTVTVAAGTVAAGWHRAGDALSGIALGTAVMSVAAWAVVGRYGQGGAPASRAWILPTGVGVASAAAALLYLYAINPERLGKLDPSVNPWAFPSAELAIGLVGGLAVWAYARLLDAVQVRRAGVDAAMAEVSAG